MAAAQCIHCGRMIFGVDWPMCVVCGTDNSMVGTIKRLIDRWRAKEQG